MKRSMIRWLRRARLHLFVLAFASLVASGCVAEEEWDGYTEDVAYAYAGNCSACEGAQNGCTSGSCPSGQWCDTGFCDCCCDNTKPTGGNKTYHTYKYGSCSKSCSKLDGTGCPNKSGGLCWVTGGDGCEDLTDTAVETLGLSPSGEYRLCNCEVTCNGSLPDNETKYEGCGKPGNGKCPALVCPGSTKVKNCTLAAQNCSKKVPGATEHMIDDADLWPTDLESAASYPSPTPTGSPTPTPSPSPTPTPTGSPTPTPTPSPTPPQMCVVCGPDEECEPCTTPSPSPSASPSATPAPAGWGS